MKEWNDFKQLCWSIYYTSGAHKYFDEDDWISDCGLIFTKLLKTHGQLEASHFGRALGVSVRNHYKNLIDNRVRSAARLESALEVFYSNEGEGIDIYKVALDSKCTGQELRVIKGICQGYTFTELAKDMGRSKVRVYQIRDSAIKRMRRQLKWESCA